MHRMKGSAWIALCACLWIAPGASQAAETAFSGYGLGAAAFGAGVTPPPGTYVSFVGGFYTADIGGAVTIGGELLELGLKVDFFQAALNGVYVPKAKVFGASPAVSITLPSGWIDLEAGIQLGGLSGTRSVSGAGVGDITGRFQLGWEHGDFSHIAYVQGTAPTGRYALGFYPDIGLNRPNVDIGWAFTWTEKTSKVQLNGTLGVTFSAQNSATDYKTGDEFHFEWAIGREVAQGLLIGIVGYNYRQISGDTGSGDIIGAFEGDVDAIGAGLVYTTLIDKTPLILNLRYYQEFGAERHWEGSKLLFSSTARF